MQQQGMDPQDQRNFIIAMVLMVVFIIGYQALVLGPAAKRDREARAAAQAEQQAEQTAVSQQASEDVGIGNLALPEVETVEEALALVERVPFNVERVDRKSVV